LSETTGVKLEVARIDVRVSVGGKSRWKSNNSSRIESNKVKNKVGEGSKWRPVRKNDEANAQEAIREEVNG